ncbi:hypothetical protein PC116_g9070 [Phytophthora cactorum]|uniref:Uncharacterized protein n=1 Tax=Phytophthora cactorum TaxID=29920 RepID=A0A8T0ZHJ4_9STRA|nr:hypothetical protein Pcac1_g26586 [Phytophthora cactorum]KAG2832516.1 hypothetical protein PC112_g6866 [Phytophthora cactorum]KAG2861686.1 hypothetical protein PC113_g6958 [Phytophthora cactorum]KAG2932227.1 hypothetical protein PC115_g5863 [Phytophthora cactorum]KAG2948069.1 hypothetical protein PC117_g6308 [Phytophthora cactorum]
MPRGEKRGLPERSGNMVKHRRTASRRAAEGDEPNESRDDRVLFKERRALRRDGWISKPPPRRSLDTRYRYVKPGHTHDGEEGSDYFLGERSLVDYYLKLHNNVVQCIGDSVRVLQKESTLTNKTRKHGDEELRDLLDTYEPTQDTAGVRANDQYDDDRAVSREVVVGVERGASDRIQNDGSGRDFGADVGSHSTHTDNAAGHVRSGVAAAQGATKGGRHVTSHGAAVVGGSDSRGSGCFVVVDVARGGEAGSKDGSSDSGLATGVEDPASRGDDTGAVTGVVWSGVRTGRGTGKAAKPTMEATTRLELVAMISQLVWMKLILVVVKLELGPALLVLKGVLVEAPVKHPNVLSVVLHP